MATKVSVVPVQFVVVVAGKRERVTAGYSVIVDFCPGGDEMWERLTHPAIFETERQAFGLRCRVENAMSAAWNETGWPLKGLNLTRWAVDGHSCSPLFQKDNNPPSYFIPAMKF